MTSQPTDDRSEREEPTTSHPNQPASDEADRSKETTPAGIAHELEEKADETGATTEPPE
jgi:hypothetical protein